MLSELQTNVCVVNHLSGTRAEKRREKENRQSGMKEMECARHREETVRDERGGRRKAVQTFTATSLSIHGA